jgi:DNA-directed RNA polymerase subunit RPC12/RpoP
MSDDRSIDLRYVCAGCGKDCHLTWESDLFAVVESQLTGETQKLHCKECNDD